MRELLDLISEMLRMAPEKPTKVLIRDDLFYDMVRAPGFWDQHETRTEIESTARIWNRFNGGLHGTVAVEPHPLEFFIRLD